MEFGGYFAAACLLLAVLTIPVADSGEANERFDESFGPPKLMPHLSTDIPTSFFLPVGIPWRPDLSSLLTALKVNDLLLLELFGEYRLDEISRVKLLYRCLPNETDYQIVPLWPIISLRHISPFCRNIRPFTVNPFLILGNTFYCTITLTDQSGIGFDQAMTHYLEFKVLFQFYEGETESGSLFVFNVDSLIRNPMALSSFTTNYGVLQKDILTDEAIQFVVTLKNTKAEPVFSIPFFTTNFINALKRASLIIRSSISISLHIRGRESCSDSLDNVDSDFVFSSGDRDDEVTLRAATKYFGYIDLFNGILVTTETDLESTKSYLRSRFTTTPISACLLISLNWPVWNYRLMATISDMLNVTELSTTGVAPSDSCDVKGGSGPDVWLTLLMGMKDVVLPNRLICSLRVNEIATVYYNDKECINNAIGSHGKWQKCNNWYSVYETANYIRFEETVQLDHSGRYRFSNRGRDFTYHITVMTLPMFNTIYHKGAVTANTKGSEIIFQCTVHHDGGKYIRLRPIFRVFQQLEDSKWQDLTIYEFTSKVLRKRPGFTIKRDKVSQSNSATYTRRHSTSLIIKLPYRTRQWNSWILNFFCEATVTTSDAKVMGLQHYSTRSNVMIEFAGKSYSLKSQRYSKANRVTAECRSLMSFVFVYFIVIFFD